MFRDISAKKWIIAYFIVVLLSLIAIGMITIRIDPFFHYHYPLVSEYYYPIDNQRYQNDGILRNFSYQGMITGTSMTECFLTSEAGEIFGFQFVKTPYEGGSFREINDCVKTAIRNNPDLKIVIRSLDSYKLLDKSDLLRTDMGSYPTYLYDDNVFNDVEYIFNRDVIFTRIYKVMSSKSEPGLTSFDSYSNWMGKLKYKYISFGAKTLFPNGVKLEGNNSFDAGKNLSEDEKRIVLENVHNNVTAIADDNPQITFYYFFPPYSAAYRLQLLLNGEFDKQIEAQEIAIEEIVKHPNIKFFDFDILTDVTTDLNNYKDVLHYGGWINSLMLNYMHDERCLVTESNFRDYLKYKKAFYTSFNYESFNTQTDYEDDYEAGVVIKKLIGEKSIN